MGFWSGLKKVFSVAAPIAGAVAAPFTGGASAAAGSALGKTLSTAGKIGNALSGIGSVAGNAAAASAKDRETQYELALKKDALAQNAYQGELNRQITVPKELTKQSAWADVMANYKPDSASILNAKTFEDLQKSRSTKGYTANEDTQKAFAEMQRQAMQNLLSPTKAPTLSTMEKAGNTEKILGGIGLGGGLGGALSSLWGYQPARTNG